ncbi:MAG: MBL fold metallo-hydrolase [Lachnospiraceae bacterium]|nr:MBL fold metallo-hydrolase [Lachnospiraceae bacterium]
MQSEKMKLTFLGTRGSVPVAGKEYETYGGATSCIRVLADKEEIYLDAGSGIVRAIPEEDTNLTILLSHLHLDHVQGLSFFPALTQADRPIIIYAEPRSGLSAQETIDRLFAPPIWPIMISDYSADVTFLPLPETLSLGEVQVSAMGSCHPGGSTIYRLTYGGASFVYATDFEHVEAKVKELIAFSEGADLLIYDGQYAEAEYERQKGYGHSTASVGARIASAAHVKKLVITHHDPGHDDSWFARMEKEYPQIAFAKDREEIIL